MLNKQRRTQTKRTRRVEIVYGIIQDEPDAGQFALMTREALEKLDAARQCTTWGAYATLCGISWGNLLADWDDEIAALTQEAEPSADAPFHFDELWGLYSVGALIPDPRTDAYDTLMDLCKELPEAIRNDERIRDIFAVDHGSPAGHPAYVQVKNEEGLKQFEGVLHETGYSNYIFTRDDTIMDMLSGRTADQ